MSPVGSKTGPRLEAGIGIMLLDRGCPIPLAIYPMIVSGSRVDRFGVYWMMARSTCVFLTVRKSLVTTVMSHNLHKQVLCKNGVINTR